MEIQEITRYKLDGVEYNNLPAIKTVIENKIGSIIDTMDIPNIRLTPKQRLHILNVITGNKEQLTKLLNVTFELDANSLQPTTKNILDL